MPLPDLAEKWSSKVMKVTIGATKAEGGTRERAITVGGSACIPFMDFEGDKGCRPVIAMDVLNTVPEWPDALKEPYKDCLDNPAKWAAKCVKECGADMICLKLDGIHPDKGNKSADDAVAAVKAVLAAVAVPIIVWGCEDDAKDNEVMPKVSQALKGERALLGVATEDNYKTLAAVCLADGHNIIGLAPLDINIAKQVNILVSDVGYPVKDVVIYPTTGALGYGLEYCYSIMERGRLAALAGDKLLQQPVLGSAGFEAWRAKECKGSDEELPDMGAASERGPIWEAVTATNLLQAGADLLVMRHPKAIEIVKKTIGRMWGNEA